MTKSQRAERFVQRSQQTGAKRVLILGESAALLPHLREFLPDALYVTVSMSPGKPGRRTMALVSDLEHLPFKRWSFDLALVFDLLPKVGEPVHLLNGILRSLRPGGQLAIGHVASAEDAPTLPELVRWLADFGARTEAAERESNEMFVLCVAP